MNCGSTYRVAAVMLAQLFAASAAQGASQAYLRIGGIEGDVTVVGHEHWSEILSYNLAVQNDGWSGGAYASPIEAFPTFSEMFVTKYFDPASPYFMGAAFAGMQFDVAKIELTKTNQGSPVTYLTWRFDDVVMSSYNTAFDQGQDRPVELLALDFRRIEYRYYPPDPRQGEYGFWYDRATATFEWIGDPPREGEFLTAYDAAWTPEPSGTLMAIVAAAQLLKRRRDRAGEAARRQEASRRSR